MSIEYACVPSIISVVIGSKDEVIYRKVISPHGRDITIDTVNVALNKFRNSHEDKKALKLSKKKGTVIYLWLSPDSKKVIILTDDCRLGFDHNTESGFEGG